MNIKKVKFYKRKSAFDKRGQIFSEVLESEKLSKKRIQRRIKVIKIKLIYQILLIQIINQI